MSQEEYNKTGGFIEQNTKGAIPYVTTDADYLIGKNGLASRENQESGKYAVLVEYKTKEGTENELINKTRKFDANQKNGVKKAKAIAYPVHKWEKPKGQIKQFRNFGFPLGNGGINSANEHFHKNFVEPPKFIRSL